MEENGHVCYIQVFNQLFQTGLIGTGRERSRTLPGLTLCTNDQINFAEIII